MDERVVALYRQGRTQADIAGHIGRNQATVSRILSRVTDRLTADAEGELAKVRRGEVARLDRVEARLWEAYEASKLPLRTERRSMRRGGDGVVTITVEERPEGVPSILAQITHLVMQRARLEGVLGPSPTIMAGELGSHPGPFTAPAPDENVLRIFIGRRKGETIEASESLACFDEPQDGTVVQDPTDRR